MRTWQQRLLHSSRTWRGSCGSILCTLAVVIRRSILFVNDVDVSLRAFV